MIAIPIALAAAGAVGAVVGLNELAHRDYLPEKVAKVAHLVYAAVIEFFAFVGHIVAHLALPFMGLSSYLVSWSEKPIEDKAIILVHGYLHNATAFFFLKPFLHLAGYRHVYTINLFPPVGRSINDYAKALEEKAKEVAKETGCKEITAIGHSMGGLVSTRAALNLAKKNEDVRINRVISLGSPFKGAFAAWIGALFGQNARDMLPGSHFTETLHNDLKDKSLSGGIRFLEFGSHMDQLVSIESSCLSRATDPELAALDRESIEIEDLGHISLLYSRTIAQKILGWLQGKEDSPINV